MNALLDLVGTGVFLLGTFGVLALVDKWANRDADPEQRFSRGGDKW